MRHRLIICFLLGCQPVLSQSLIEGTVLNKETGEAVPFASVGIAGTARGTSTNINGEFSISASAPASLLISCVGFQTLELDSVSSGATILLTPSVTQLKGVVISNKPINARKIVQRAFASIKSNYATEPFLQRFFYRHYCKDNDVHGRLIEAFVDVWKEGGYTVGRRASGEKESIRIRHLRRSLDNTMFAQGHEPISVSRILELDLIGYQAPAADSHLDFYSNVSNIKPNISEYHFSLIGITFQDNKEVYEIAYALEKDSVLLSTGEHRMKASASGSLFVDTESYALVKATQSREQGDTHIETSIFYRKHSGRYYPYHYLITGKNALSSMERHEYRIELISLDVERGEHLRFVAPPLSEKQLLAIEYDSLFWARSSSLKATRLEKEIIRDLGGGQSLSEQFQRYREHFENTHDGGESGGEKLEWLINFYRGEKPVFLVFWDESFTRYLVELEMAKRLSNEYQKAAAFVFVSLDEDNSRWEETVRRFNYMANGIVNYRIEKASALLKKLNVSGVPSFVLVPSDGTTVQHCKPTDPATVSILDNLKR